MRRILAGSGFRDYRELVYEAPLHQTLIYLNARGLDAMLREMRQKSRKAAGRGS